MPAAGPAGHTPGTAAQQKPAQAQAPSSTGELSSTHIGALEGQESLLKAAVLLGTLHTQGCGELPSTSAATSARPLPLVPLHAVGDGGGAVAPAAGGDHTGAPLRYLPIQQLAVTADVVYVPAGTRKPRSARRKPATHGGVAGAAALAMALPPLPEGAGASLMGVASGDASTLPHAAAATADEDPTTARGRVLKRPSWMASCATAAEQQAYLLEQQRRRAAALAALQRRDLEGTPPPPARPQHAAAGSYAPRHTGAGGVAAAVAAVGAGGGRCVKRRGGRPPRRGPSQEGFEGVPEDEEVAAALLSLIGVQVPAKAKQQQDAVKNTRTDTRPAAAAEPKRAPKPSGAAAAAAAAVFMSARQQEHEAKGRRLAAAVAGGGGADGVASKGGTSARLVLKDKGIADHAANTAAAVAAAAAAASAPAMSTTQQQEASSSPSDATTVSGAPTAELAGVVRGRGDTKHAGHTAASAAEAALSGDAGNRDQDQRHQLARQHKPLAPAVSRGRQNLQQQQQQQQQPRVRRQPHQAASAGARQVALPAGVQSQRQLQPSPQHYSEARAWLLGAGLLRREAGQLDQLSAGLWLQWQAVLQCHAAGQGSQAMALAYRLGAATGALMNSCGSSGRQAAPRAGGAAAGGGTSLPR